MICVKKKSVLQSTTCFDHKLYIRIGLLVYTSQKTEVTNTVIAWKEYRAGIFCFPSAIYGSFQYAILFHLMHSPSIPLCPQCELTQSCWLTIKKNSEKGVSVVCNSSARWCDNKNNKTTAGSCVRSSYLRRCTFGDRDPRIEVVKEGLSTLSPPEWFMP